MAITSLEKSFEQRTRSEKNQRQNRPGDAVALPQYVPCPLSPSPTLEESIDETRRCPLLPSRLLARRHGRDRGRRIRGEFVTHCMFVGRKVPAGVRVAAASHFQGDRGRPREFVCRMLGYRFQQPDGASHEGSAVHPTTCGRNAGTDGQPAAAARNLSGLSGTDRQPADLAEPADFEESSTAATQEALFET
jgi:hypothetical protein